MDNLFMFVYRMNHPDGSPRKNWAYVDKGGEFITRWGPAVGRKLQEHRKPSASVSIQSTCRKKEQEGYEYVGEFNVSDEIHWTNQAAQPAAQPAPAAAQPQKFANAVIHWTAKKLPEGWLRIAVDAMDGVKTEVSVQQNGDDIFIHAFDKSIKLSGARAVSTGTVTEGDGDWMAGLILLRLAKDLPIEVVDDQSNIVDRRNLKSLFEERGHLFSGEYEDFATSIGLMPKISESIKKAEAMFF